jgi:hypothetical protein
VKLFNFFFSSVEHFALQKKRSPFCFLLSFFFTLLRAFFSKKRVEKSAVYQNTFCTWTQRKKKVEKTKWTSQLMGLEFFQANKNSFFSLCSHKVHLFFFEEISLEK